MNVAKIVAAVLLFAAPALAADPKSYQVTGPITEIRGDVIVVQKGPKENWEIATGGKLGPDVKVGTKVTVQYRMTATQIEVKETKGAAKDTKAGKSTKKK